MGPGESPEQFGHLVWVLLKKLEGRTFQDTGFLERCVSSGFT